ncbi:hypothetical protein CRG98_015945 [Punica granatum]|nr:hypothetical protein CRG98_015945 [Punica granatum]
MESELVSSSDSRTWTTEQNKLFENALAVHDRETPNRWQDIAKAVGGTSVNEVKRWYEILQRDIELIESDKIPIPKYRTSSESKL